MLTYSRHSLAHFVHYATVSPKCFPTPNCSREAYLVESRHRLICRPNLQLIPICFEVSALVVRTLNLLKISCHSLKHHSLVAPTFRFVNIIPRTLTAQGIVRLFRCYCFPLEELFLENELIWAGEAFEAGPTFDGGGGGVARRHLGDAEHVVAVWADWTMWSVIVNVAGLVTYRST